MEFPSLLTDRAKDTLVRGVLDKADRYGKVLRLMTWDTYSRSCSQMPGADGEKNGHINAWFTIHPDWAKTTFEDVTSSPLTQYITDHPNKDDDDMPCGGHAKHDRVAINLWLRRKPRSLSITSWGRPSSSGLTSKSGVWAHQDRRRVVNHAGGCSDRNPPR